MCNLYVSTSVCAHVTSVTRVKQMFKFTYKLTLTDLGGHNLGTYYARKLKFRMLLTHT